MKTSRRRRIEDFKSTPAGVVDISTGELFPHGDESWRELTELPPVPAPPRTTPLPFDDTSDALAIQTPARGYVAPSTPVRRAQERVHRPFQQWQERLVRKEQLKRLRQPLSAKEAVRGYGGVRSPMQSRRVTPYTNLNKLQESLPSRVAHCVGRMIRRRVLHALGIAGKKKSPGRGGTYRRTIYSQWRC